jgi:prepilin-type N-terminal cleavage/methylation domain-containing protein
MLYYKKEYGFSIVELMVVIAIIGIISAASVPNLKRWSRNYNVQSAAMDLYAHMQMAKLGAVKENKSWTINFNPDVLLGYQIRNNAGNVVKTVDFRTQYNSEIQYVDPTETKTYDDPSIVFNPNGLSDIGYAYLSNKSKSTYYRIGMLYATGSIKIEKWNGTQWK